MNIPEKQQNNDDGHAPLGATQSLRSYPTRMFGGGSVVSGGRLPIVGSGMLGGAAAGCIILCRVSVYRATGGNVIGGDGTLCRAIFQPRRRATAHCTREPYTPGHSTVASGYVLTSSFLSPLAPTPRFSARGGR